MYVTKGNERWRELLVNCNRGSRWREDRWWMWVMVRREWCVYIERKDIEESMGTTRLHCEHKCLFYLIFYSWKESIISSFALTVWKFVIHLYCDDDTKRLVFIQNYDTWYCHYVDVTSFLLRIVVNYNYKKLVYYYKRNHGRLFLGSTLHGTSN